ncbi:MAG: hypothetical protein LBG93_01710 [Treponema sp.]|jgi:hypothetical protein|nr:hypothetical protein [Treponema sp.]
MADNSDYVKKLTDALAARADHLEKYDLPKLKEELRHYHTGFASLYNLYVKKGLIHEDPYKQEAKIAEIEVPNSTTFSEAEKLDQLTQRLANYDNQLDFLVNFYQYSPEFLTMDRIKRILGLVKYIDWVQLSPDSQNIMTRVVADMTNQIKIGTEPLTMSVITESISNLNKSFNPIIVQLKLLADYQREMYKLQLRGLTSGLPQAEASNVPNLRKKMAQTMPGVPFYPDLLEEVLKEDYSGDGPALREAVLKKLMVAENKPKAAKAPISFRTILLEGVYGLGATAVTFQEILVKMDENQLILENRKQTLLEKLKKLFQQMFNREPDPVIYEVEYIDPAKGAPVSERVNFYAFRGDVERKIRTLSPMVRGVANSKLDSVQEDQLAGFLDRNVREIQSLHKILGALDDFFKAAVDKPERDRIRGIKPELGTIKNAIVRANSKRYEYNAQKEQEEQLKRLGVSPDS